MTTPHPTGRRPCPGSCNAAWRNDHAAALKAIDRAAQRRSGIVTLAERRLIEAGSPLMATPGEPLWCRDCTDRVSSDLVRLPELAVSLWAVGHTGEQEDPWRLVLMRCLHHGPGPLTHSHIGSRALVEPEAVVGFVERLGCGHLLNTVRAPRPAPGITFRLCLQCALEDPGDSGALAYPADATTVRGTRSGSPALSASWLAIDELVNWCGRTEDYLRGWRRDRPALLDWWAGGYTSRHKAMTSAVAYLVAHVQDLLTAPRAEEIVSELHHLTSRAEASSATARSDRLRIPCPKCDRRALRLRFAETTARCVSCGAEVAVGPMDRARADYVEGDPQ